MLAGVLYVQVLHLRRNRHGGVETEADGVMDEDPVRRLRDVRRAIYSDRDRGLAEAWKVPLKQESPRYTYPRAKCSHPACCRCAARGVRQTRARQAWRSALALDEATLFDRIFYRAERRGANRRLELNILLRATHAVSANRDAPMG